MHAEVWQTISDVQRKDVPIIRTDMLQSSSNFNGLVIDVIQISLDLTAGMNCLALTSVCILVKDKDNVSFL